MASLIQNSITKFELILVLINFLKNLNYTPLAENATTIISCTLSNHQHFVRVNASRGRPMYSEVSEFSNTQVSPFLQWFNDS